LSHVYVLFFCSVWSVGYEFDCCCIYSAAWWLLFSLLSSAAAALFVSSHALTPLGIPHLQQLATTLASGGGGVPKLTQSVRLALAGLMAYMAWDVREKATEVDPSKPKKVFEFYMYIWNIFYACYVVLPALRV
jgi:hypothetical protein